MIQYEEIKSALSSLKPELEGLKTSLDLNGAQDEIAKLQHEAQKPDFWDDPDKGQKVLQKIKQLQAKVDSYNEGPLYNDNLREIYGTILKVMKETPSA